MAPKILVVDRNEAFAIMLEQMLATDGGYEVQVVHTGRHALALLREADFDLTILDMDLGPEGIGYRDLIQSVRQVRPMMRLMLIPLMGEELPPEVDRLDIQGTLTKPFFVDDLLPIIEETLSRTVRLPESQPALRPALASVQGQVPIGATTVEVQKVLVGLARETTADAVLLLSSDPNDLGVVAHVSTLSAEKVQMLTHLIVKTVQAAQAAAHFLGQPDAPFEHNMFEGEGLRLYAMALASDLLLVVQTPLGIPLGTIRHNLRRASRELASLALT
jgi:DNA-binding response OmpR family regulator